MGCSIFLESAEFPRPEYVQREILDRRVCGQIRADENLVRGLAFEIFQPLVFESTGEA
jgi:hypothetical protein